MSLPYHLSIFILSSYYLNFIKHHISKWPMQSSTNNLGLIFSQQLWQPSLFRQPIPSSTRQLSSTLMAGSLSDREWRMALRSYLRLLSPSSNHSSSNGCTSSTSWPIQPTTSQITPPLFLVFPSPCKIFLPLSSSIQPVGSQRTRPISNISPPLKSAPFLHQH